MKTIHLSYVDLAIVLTLFAGFSSILFSYSPNGLISGLLFYFVFVSILYISLRILSRYFIVKFESARGDNGN